MTTWNEPAALEALARIAQALERRSPAPAPAPDWNRHDAFVWEPEASRLKPVEDMAAIELSLLLGIEPAREALMANSLQFARGYSANNALLWGARGMGKSSLVKAVFSAINRDKPHALALIEIHRGDLPSLPQLMPLLRGSGRRCILYCDDLSFDAGDAQYKALKTALEGGIEGRPENVLFYATSNRRHLMPREMVENERATAIHPGEAAEEKISLSDRFGLWLGFHACGQEMYLSMVEHYARRFKLPVGDAELSREALQWAQARGGRSGRVAWQFILHLAGKLQKKLD